MKAVQYFSDEQLERSQQMSQQARLQFLDDYRRLHGSRAHSSKSKLISLKVPEDLLETFKRQCELHNVKYQTQIKQLMREYLRQ